jgi:hypothetical protein
MEGLDAEGDPSALALVAPNPSDSPIDEDGRRQPSLGPPYALVMLRLDEAETCSRLAATAS